MKRILVLIPLLLGGLATFASAQPDVNNAPKGDNPQNRRAADNARRREQAMAERTRTQLKKLGVADVTQQEAILDFVEKETEARDAIEDKGQELAQLLRNDASTTAQITAALNDYQAAIQDDKLRHDKALAAFKKKVEYSKNPRLESYLTVSGVIGDGPAIFGGNQRRVRVRINTNKPKPAEAPAPAAP